VTRLRTQSSTGAFARRTLRNSRIHAGRSGQARPDTSIASITAAPQLLYGKADLDRVRDARPATGAEQAETVLTPYDQVIDVFGDLALARYWLRVEPPAEAVQLVRNTALLVRARGDETDRWLFVHLHEDVHSSSNA